MNSEEARQVLVRYRPGIDDGSDPELAEALRLVESDPELKQWLERQSALHQTVRSQLRTIPVPGNLGSRIIAGRPKIIPLWRRREFLAAAAAVTGLLVLSAIWFWRPVEEHTFAAFRSRMVRFALREYRMDLLTNDPGAVRQHMARNGAPADYTLTPGLEARPVIGGAKLSWQNHPVAMVCFSAPTNQTMYLFVLDRTALRYGNVPGNTPVFVSINGLSTASWTAGNKTYLLAAPTSEEELRKLP